MTTFALLAGAGGDASHLYSRVVPLLRARNHEALAIDLPADDEAAGLPEYADVVVQALAGRTGVVLVAHSLSGFTAPLVMERTPVRALVFLNAMLPRPGERAAEWWDNTGVSAAREAQADRDGYPREVELETYFTHDVDPAIAAEGRDADATRRRPRSCPPATSAAGLTSPCARLRARTTGSSRSASSNGWPAIGSASTPTRFPADTCSPCRNRRRSCRTCFYSGVIGAASGR